MPLRLRPLPRLSPLLQWIFIPLAIIWFMQRQVNRKPIDGAVSLRTRWSSQNSQPRTAGSSRCRCWSGYQIPSPISEHGLGNKTVIANGGEALTPRQFSFRLFTFSTRWTGQFACITPR